VGVFTRLAARSLHKIKKIVKENPRFRSIWADADNLNEFDDPTSHEIMLVDAQRVDAYKAAIDKHIGKNDVVIDLGTGNGILAFLASRKAKKVYAIDRTEFIENARRVAEDNGLNNIEFRRCDSRDFRLDEKVDAIVHEQIGDDVFEEGMTVTVLDLRDRLLKPGGRILPNRFNVYLEPIEMKDRYRVPFIWEIDIDGISFRSLRETQSDLPGQGHPTQDYHRLRLMPEEVEHLLCEPKPIMSFDLETMSADDLPKLVRYENTAVRDGRLDGLYLYFEAMFDDEIRIDTHPRRGRTNWEVDLFRLEGRQVKAGDTLAFDLSIRDFANAETWSIALDKANQATTA
jgi:protein arginine N-methyltransferase 1